MRTNLPLATRLTLLFILFALAIITGVGWLSYASGRDSLHRATVSELHATALEKQAALNAWVEDRQAAVAALSTSISVREALAAYTAATPGSVEAQSAHARLAADLQAYTAQRQFLDLLVIEPADGQVIAASSDFEEGKYREDQPYFINGKNGPYVQNVYYSTALQAPAMTVSAPILDEQGSLLGVLAGRLNLEEMNAIINRRSGLRYSDEAFLVTSSNLFATQPRLVPDPAVLLRGVHTEAVNRCLARSSGVIAALDYRGIPVLVTYRWLPERGLCLIVKMDETEALAPVHAFGRTIALVGGVTLLVAFLLAIGLGRSITGPLLALQAGTARIAAGELSLRLPETAPGELGQLASAFNAMAASISQKDAQLRAQAQTLEQKVEERTRELQESEEHYRLLFTGIRHGFALHEVICNEAGQPVDYRFLEINPAYETLTGLRAADLIGHTVLEILPGTERHWIETFGHVALTGESVQFSNYSRELGKYYEVAAYRPKPGQFAVIFMDVTERMLAEIQINDLLVFNQKILENSPVGILTYKLTGECLFANENAASILGTDTEHLKEQNFHKIESWKKSGMYDFIQKVIATGEATSGDIHHLSTFGKDVWLIAGAAIFRSNAGDHVLLTISDITERKKMETALRESEASLKNSQSVSHVGDWSWDVPTNRVTWSDEMYRIFGLDPENFSGDLNEIISTAIHPDDRAAVFSANAAVLTEQKPQALEYRVVWPDGSVHTVWAMPGDKFTDADGKILRLTGIVQDITERKLADEAL